MNPTLNGDLCIYKSFFFLLGPNSPPNSTSTPSARDALAALELSRLTLWNLYGGGGGIPEPKAPPQQEALNLEVPTRSSEGAHTPKAPMLSNHVDSPSPKSTKSHYSHVREVLVKYNYFFLEYFYQISYSMSLFLTVGEGEWKKKRSSP